MTEIKLVRNGPGFQVLVYNVNENLPKVYIDGMTYCFNSELVAKKDVSAKEMAALMGETNEKHVNS